MAFLNFIARLPPLLIEVGDPEDEPRPSPVVSAPFDATTTTD